MQLVQEVTRQMPEPAGKKLTLEELRAKSAKAVTEATKFEKTPTFNMRINDEIAFRVKSVVTGNFPEPMVVSNDFRVFDGQGKFLKGTLQAYKQEGKDGPREFVEVKPGEDVRVPRFVVARAIQKNGIDFKPGFIYWAKFISEAKTAKGMFKVAAVSEIEAFPPGE
jgi:uncharacterized protein YdhG (YjbR/CyaY superfamily)